VDVVTRRVGVSARTVPFALSTWALLAGLVGVSALVRFLLALSHPTPLFFADEYIYSTLAHELATTGRPTIRGDAASFPALLQPILTAPFWLFGDAGVALRLTQALNAVAMSLAAVPVFVLARKLGLARAFALAAAVLAVLVPDLFYVAYILAEPIAYPLVLGAIYVGVRVLDQPTRWNQAAFVALAGLATFARIQFIVLPVAFVVAALVVRTGLRRLKLTFGLFALAAVPVGLKGVGYYSGIADFHVDPSALLHWFAVDSMLLAYAAGWLVVPGALVVLARPRPGIERAFAALTVTFAAGLFLEAVLFATNADRAPGGRFQERYLFTLIPLFLLAFGLSLGRGGRVRWAVAVIAAVLVAVSARFPLAGWVDDHGRQDSPLLMGVYRLSEGVGYANASFVVAAAVAGLAGAAVAVAYRPRFALPAVAAMGVLLALVGYGAWALDSRYAQRARATYFPADASWIDSAGVGEVTLVNTPGSRRELPLEQMFWNRSIDQLVRLRGADGPDMFSAPRVVVRRDGALLVEGRPLRRALLLNEYAVTAELTGAKSVAENGLFELWQPVGTPRLRLLAGGRFYDSWLANSGFVRVWGPAGTLRLELSLPERAPTSRMVFRWQGRERAVVVRPGSSQVVEFAVPRGPWTIRWKGPLNHLPDGRPVSVRADELSLSG
jgi:Dolichyl-phosphate-mannose-protein mannosyltransferase